MMKKRNNLQHENGNVLFLILIAVALFAALSYAVTQSTRSGGGDSSREQARLIASNFMTLFSEIDSALTRLQLSNECKDEEIGLAPTVISNTGTAISDVAIWSDGTTANISSYGNAPLQWGHNRRTDGTCDLFGTDGGNVKMTITQTSTNQFRMWSNFLFSAIEVVPIQSQNMTATDDLYIGIWADASNSSEVAAARPICEIINQLSAVPFPSTGGTNTYWTGYGTGEFWGKRTYCLFDPPSSVVIMHIIAER